MTGGRIMRRIPHARNVRQNQRARYNPPRRNGKVSRSESVGMARQGLARGVLADWTLSISMVFCIIAGKGWDPRRSQGGCDLSQGGCSDNVLRNLGRGSSSLRARPVSLRRRGLQSIRTYVNANCPKSPKNCGVSRCLRIESRITENVGI